MKKFLIINILVFLNLSCMNIVNDLFDDMVEIVPICVDNSASPGGDGRGWVNAVPDIAEALTLVKEGGEIWVRAGNYDVSEIIIIGESIQNISIYGGFTGTESKREERDASVMITSLNDTGGIGTISLIDARDITIDGFSFMGSMDLGPNSSVSIAFSEGIIFRSCVFDSLSSTGNGMAVKIAESGVTVENSTFRNNFSENDGSAVYATDGARVNISASNFTDNKSNMSGGAIYVSGSTLNINNSIFSDNGATITTESGGAIYAVDSDSTISSSNFRNNRAVSGGAIYLSNTTGSISNSTLSGNYTKYNIALATISHGGALYIDNMNNKELNIVNTKFLNNGHDGSNAQTSSGGAIYLKSGSLKISGTESEISSNCASDNGSGIYAESGSLVINDATISNNGFLGNNTGYGGGIYFKGSGLTINNSVVNNNKSKYSGGGIYLGSSGNAKINSSKFTGNSAGVGNSIGGNGGAIYITDNISMTTVNSYFYDNKAYDDGNAAFGNGGAIYSSSNSSMQYINVTFFSNYADSSGGALYLNEGTHSFFNSVFYSNMKKLTVSNIDKNQTSTLNIYNSFYNGGISGIIKKSDNIENITDSPFVSTDPSQDNFLYPAELMGDDCIDSGMSYESFIPIDASFTNFIAPTKDLAGNPRVVGSGVDMGAYEKQ